MTDSTAGVRDGPMDESKCSARGVSLVECWDGHHESEVLQPGAELKVLVQYVVASAEEKAAESERKTKEFDGAAHALALC
jgi:hypothetical protein